ncbi:hypothetical protein SSX86_001857 [Deinandra increscens subsp. villosa]|uniref:EF-hand domain-containing protein n=1 Tax=Deinandra increscens subsp. villosa TaxID=3103831 RepID=A0AAP0DW73_9ASTR
MTKNYSIDVIAADVNDFEKVFRKFNANGDGKISISELKSILDALGSVTPEDELKVTKTVSLTWASSSSFSGEDATFPMEGQRIRGCVKRLICMIWIRTVRSWLQSCISF